MEDTDEDSVIGDMADLESNKPNIYNNYYLSLFCFCPSLPTSLPLFQEPTSKRKILLDKI